MKASIIIASFNRNDLLWWNIHSLKRHLPPDVEIIVLDDGYENDRRCVKIAEEFDCIYAHTGKAKGPKNGWRIPGFAFNIGAKFATGDTLVLSCAEVYHPHNTLGLMLDVMEDDAVVIPRCIRDDKGAIITQLNAHVTPTAGVIQRLKALDATLPFFMAMKRQRFLDIGGYDEDFTGVCWDDNDITDRLILSGGKYVPVEVEVVHLFHQRHNYRSAEIMKRWNHNKDLYDQRRGRIYRNQDREWGVWA